MTTLNEHRDKVHGWAKSKGWHDDNLEVIDYVARTATNIHGEVSELWEAARKGELYKPCDKNCGLTCLEEELIDIMIRCFDTAGRLGVDLDQAFAFKHGYNETRQHRHGGKLA